MSVRAEGPFLSDSHHAVVGIHRHCIFAVSAASTVPGARMTNMKRPAANSCIWPQAPSHCRHFCRLQKRKPIHRGRCTSSRRSRLAGRAMEIARLVAQKLTENLGKQFYVENQVGANLGMAARRAPRLTAIRFCLRRRVMSSIRASTPRCHMTPTRDFAPLTVTADAANILQCR
jgi:hypothetical protein